jgi:hypothetical protein
VCSRLVSARIHAFADLEGVVTLILQDEPHRTIGPTSCLNADIA